MTPAACHPGPRWSPVGPPPTPEAPAPAAPRAGPGEGRPAVPLNVPKPTETHIAHKMRCPKPKKSKRIRKNHIAKKNKERKTPTTSNQKPKHPFLTQPTPLPGLLTIVHTSFEETIHLGFHQGAWQPFRLLFAHTSQVLPRWEPWLSSFDGLGKHKPAGTLRLGCLNRWLLNIKKPPINTPWRV